GGSELPVRLQPERKGLIVDRPERGRNLAGAVEARVERSVRVVAREREEPPGALLAVSGRDELPVGLQDEREWLVVGRPERGRDLARAVEACVKRAGREVAGEREDALAAAAGVAGGDQPARRPLQDLTDDVATRPDRGRDLSP